MELPIEHLATFAAILDEGSFEGAAKRLRITPSAVSQRVKAMEQRVGSVLLQRTRPVAVTAAGATVLRLARQLDRLVDDAARELGAGPSGATSGPALIPIVVNADSLATWFVPALARAARETGAHFEVLRADETVSTAALRSGTVVAALTATREPVPGCISSRIGAARYHAVASAAFVAQHFPHGTSAQSLASAPMVEFDRHDHFQQRYLRRVTRARIDPPRHFVPSSAEFALAVELGMGWGMLPDAQCAGPIAEGRLVELQPAATIDLPLYWQRWNLHSPVLDALSAIVEEEGRAALTQQDRP